jgi:hypothetical protein
VKKSVVFSIPVFSIRRIETPFERRPGYKNYLAVIDVRNLPDLEDWRDINVRDAKLRGRVPGAIRRSFADKPEEFFFMNRGMVIAAERVEFIDGSTQKKIELVMRDPEIHGLLDGGHTYRVVTEASKGMASDEAPRFVRVEIITGFDRDTISDVVEARNTSNQVRDESLANLRQEFEPLKYVLKDQPYAELIAWSEYEELETGKAKPIDVRDIISYLIAFDTVEYNSTNQPLISYKDKRACLKHFQEHEKRLRKLYPLLPDILKIWDEIHLNWRAWYNKGRAEESGVDGRFGKLTAVSRTPETMYFKEVDAEWRMPEAYKYPILSAMRAAIRVQGKGAEWAADPFELLNSCGEQLAAIVGNSVRTTNNPNKVGKDVGVWSSCYLVVTNSLQGTITNKAEKKIKELEAQLAVFKRAAR